MTVISNPDPTVFVVSSDFDADVRAFFLSDLSIDLTGVALSISQDTIGRIMSIDVDVALTGPQITQVQDEFFNMMSIDSIINLLSTISVSSATTYLTDQGATTPATVTIGGANQLTDISVTDDWNLRPDEVEFILTDDDTGELQYTGLISKTVTINYSLNMGVTNSFDHIYAALMLTPDAGVKAEIPGSRMYLETINGNDGMPVANSITIQLNPLDKLKINVANFDNGTNITISVATLSVR